MNLIPLHDEFFKESDHTTLEHPCPGCLSFPFLTVGQIDICNISIFVAWASYAKLLAMPADVSVKPFKTFPKELHVCRETHMTLITSGICHAHVKVLKIWFPVGGQYLLEGFNVKTGCYLITDGADYLVVGYGGRRIYHDSAEHLVM